MQYIHFDSEQYLFDKNRRGLWVFAKLVLKVIVYIPLLISGYAIADLVLNKNEVAVLWMATTGIFALLLFLFIYFLKGISIALLEARNYLCIPILIFCIIYTCIVPSWFIFQWVDPLMLRLSPNTGRIFTWIISTGMAIYIYSQYKFLGDNAPNLAFPFYRMGYQLTKKIIRPMFD